MEVIDQRPVDFTEYAEEIVQILDLVAKLPKRGIPAFHMAEFVIHAKVEGLTLDHCFDLLRQAYGSCPVELKGKHDDRKETI